MKKNKITDQSHISLREVGYEGIDKLWWITVDRKAFKSPLRDWINDKDYFLKYVKDKNTVIQAGGNCGMYARFYGNYFENVYSFEPNINNFTCLEKNCQYKKYKIKNVGLGDKITNADLIHPFIKRSNMGVWQTLENESGKIKIITIDSLNLKRCDLIHLDVENFEDKVLIGAEQTIQKFKPVIILEAGHGSSIAEKFGYKVIHKLTTDWILLYE